MYLLRLLPEIRVIFVMVQEKKKLQMYFRSVSKEFLRLCQKNCGSFGILVISISQDSTSNSQSVDTQYTRQSLLH